MNEEEKRIIEHARRQILEIQQAQSPTLEYEGKKLDEIVSELREYLPQEYLFRISKLDFYHKSSLDLPF